MKTFTATVRCPRHKPLEPTIACNLVEFGEVDRLEASLGMHHLEVGSTDTDWTIILVSPNGERECVASVLFPVEDIAATISNRVAQIAEEGAHS